MARIQYYYNGVVHTADSLEAVPSPHLLVHDGRIWHASAAEAPLGLDFRRTGFEATRREYAQSVDFIDLRGATILPGLCDAHVHFLWWSDTLEEVDLTAAKTEAEATRAVAMALDSRPWEDGEWIVGHGWAHNLWPHGSLPTREALDLVTGNRPALLTSKCGHLGWANTAALKLAEVDTAADPAGGVIDRHASGALTGVLKENAIALVARLIPERTFEQRRRSWRKGQRLAHELGLTAMHTPESICHWDVLQRVHQAGELTMRVNFLIPAASLPMVEELRLTDGFGDDTLRLGGVKLFADGSLGGRTALMVEPYEGEPTNVGVCTAEPAEIWDITMRAQALGLPMVIHAIGDQAVRNVLKVYDAAHRLRDDAGLPRLRHRIEHLQVFHADDGELIRQVRPVASMQPVHLCADMGPADRYWGARARRAYAVATLAAMGCELAFGSDAPVEPIDPWKGIFAAVTRRNLQNAPEGGWYPEERISLPAALDAYTMGPARVAGMESRLGSLAAGKWADFCVYTQDPFQMQPHEWIDLRPVATFIAGKQVTGSV